MDRENFCHHWTHIITLSDCILLRQRLRAIMEPSSYTLDRNTQRVRILYFDEITRGTLQQQLIISPSSTRFRLCSYQQETGALVLEKLEKQNGFFCRATEPIDKKTGIRLLTGDINWIPNSSQPLLAELFSKMCYQNLRPKTLVDFLQERFCYPSQNIYITIDSDIHSGLNYWDFFQPKLSSMRPCVRGCAILKIRYQTEISSLIREIISLSSRNIIFSSQSAFHQLSG